MLKNIFIIHSLFVESIGIVGPSDVNQKKKDTHSNAGRMMDVHDAFDVGAGGMHGRVKDKARHVDSKVRCSLVDQVALRDKKTQKWTFFS